MKQTMPLGRAAGIRIGAHWSVLAMVLLIGWLLGAQVLPGLAPHESAVAYWAVAVPGAVTFIAALLAHEIAHSLVARIQDDRIQDDMEAIRLGMTREAHRNVRWFTSLPSTAGSRGTGRRTGGASALPVSR